MALKAEAIHKFNEELSFQSFAAIRQLLDKTVLKHIEHSFDLNAREADKVLERMERVYLIHSACLGECCHLLDAANLRDLSGIVQSIFRGFKYIFEWMIKVCLQKMDELAELSKRQSDPSQAALEPEKRQGPPEMHSSLGLEEERLALEEKRRKKLLTMFNFQAEEEERAVKEERRRFIDKKVGQMLDSVSNGKALEFDAINEPDVLFAFSSEMFKLMRLDGDQTMRQCSDALAEIDSMVLQKAEAPEKIEQIVMNLMENVRRVNGYNSVKEIGYNEEYIRDRIEAVEEAIIKTFDTKQRQVALAVLRVFNDLYRKPKVSKETMTLLSGKQFESQIKLQTEKTNAKLKLGQQEGERVKAELGEAKRKTEMLEGVLQELMGSLRDKEDEVVALMKKYESPSANEQAINTRRKKIFGFADIIGQLATTKTEDSIKFEHYKSKLRWVVKKMCGGFAAFTKQIGERNITKKSYEQMKEQLKANIDNLVQEEFGLENQSSRTIDFDNMLSEEMVQCGVAIENFVDFRPIVETAAASGNLSLVNVFASRQSVLAPIQTLDPKPQTQPSGTAIAVLPRSSSKLNITREEPNSQPLQKNASFTSSESMQSEPTPVNDRQHMPKSKFRPEPFRGKLHKTPKTTKDDSSFVGSKKREAKAPDYPAHLSQLIRLIAAIDSPAFSQQLTTVLDHLVSLGSQTAVRKICIGNKSIKLVPEAGPAPLDKQRKTAVVINPA